MPPTPFILHLHIFNLSRKRTHARPIVLQRGRNATAVGFLASRMKYRLFFFSLFLSFFLYNKIMAGIQSGVEWFERLPLVL